MESTLTPREEGRILIVDDQDANLQLARFFLKNAGYKHIEEARNGEEALEKIAAFKPDLILLDIVMPGMDGFAVCRELKKDQQLRRIPVLFISGLTDIANRTQGYRLGAVDYVNKPFNSSELVARADVQIENGILLRTLEQYYQRVSTELAAARETQESLLPSADEIKTIEKKHRVKISPLFKACDELAGDYWSVFDIDDDQVGLTMVDFTGHGVPSALNTVRLHALFHELSGLWTQPAVLTHAMNNRLHHLLPVMDFATFLYGVYSRKEQTFRYVGCGAPPVATLTGDKVAFHDTAGLPLGLIGADGFTLEERTISLKPGSSLFFHSDALSETVHGENQRWDEKILTKELKEAAGKKGRRDLSTLVYERFSKTAAFPLKDDLTLLSFDVLK